MSGCFCSAVLQRAFKQLKPWKSTLKRTLNGCFSKSTTLKHGATCCTKMTDNNVIPVLPTQNSEGPDLSYIKVVYTLYYVGN